MAKYKINDIKRQKDPELVKLLKEKIWSVNDYI